MSLLERLMIASVPNFECEFYPTEVHLKTREPSNVSTIFGSNDRFHIIVTGESIKRIPHDFVHASISSICEGRSLLGLTPDIVFDDNCFIEIATSQRNTEESLINQISDKLTKYAPLISSCPSFNIISVSRSYVKCYDGQISLEHQRVICNAYQQGLNILNEYKSKFRIEEFAFVRQILGDLPREFKCEPIRKDLPEDDILNYVPLRFDNFDIYRSKFTSTTIDMGSSIQFPMVIPSSDNMDDIQIHDGSAIVNVWSDAILQYCTHKKRPMGFKELEADVYLKEHKLTSDVDKRLSYDEFTTRLDQSDRVELALRGLWAKKLKDHPLVQESRLKKKKGLSWAQYDDDVQTFLDCRSEDLLLGCCKFIDAFVREIILNSKRNMKRVGQFIIRKINGYDSFIIIKPTRKSTDDDRPIFYSLIFRRPRVLNNRVFLKVNKFDDNWYYTDFTSLTLKRCEHVIGLDKQVIAHKHALMEDLSAQYTFESLLHIVLVLLADSNELSLFNQQLRYYYMELFSGNAQSLRTSEKICEKFPYPVRSKVTMYYIHKLIRIHGSLTQEYINTSVKGLNEDDARDGLPIIESLFGFHIVDLTTMLRSSYMSMLKNKDEQNKGHDSKVILNKMLKWEFFRLSKEGVVPKLLSDFEPFDYSEEVIFNESKEYLSAVAGESGMSISDFKSEIVKRSLLRTPMANLASTKSSSIVQAGDEYDKRSKVFIELLRITFSSPYLMSNFKSLIKDFSWDSQRISLFKKNQIGGVREIYILPIILRLLVRCVEDCSRSFCEMDKYEKLTDPESRDKFIDSHFMKLNSSVNVKDQKVRTLKWSGDMSSWANLFDMRQFEVMMMSIFPSEILPMCASVISIMKEKIFRLPDQVIKNFNDNPNSELSEELSKLKMDFISKRNILMVGDDSFRMKTNMMQGIFHYTSSLYHSIYLRTLCKLIQKEFPHCIWSYEVSSDDEGILISIHSDTTSDLTKQCNKLKRQFYMLKDKCDKLFGVRTSFIKSTLSFKDVFEFNSKFAFGNCLRSPLIKFVSRAVDDNPAETLRDRISSFHQQLRQIRENGGSGELCELIAVQQKELFMRNLGSEMTWFDDDAKDLMSKHKLSYLGHYELPNAMIAGIVGVEYFDWLACANNPLTHRVASKIMPRAGLLTDDNFNIRFDLWKKTKYEKMLNDLSLQRQFDISDLEECLSRKYTSSGERRLIEIMALSPSVAKCFSRIDRNECVSLSAYLLYSSVFLSKCLSDIIQESEKCDPLPITYLFPLEVQYQRILSLTSVKRYKMRLRNQRRSKLGVFYPAISRNVQFSNAKDMISSMWFGRSKLSIYSYKKLLGELKVMFPWFDEDPFKCLKQSPFESFLELKAFIETINKREKPMRIVSKANRVGDVLESLIEYDTYNGFRFTPGIMTSEEKHDSSIHSAISDFEGAFLRWQKLAPFINDKMSAVIEEHLEDYAKISKETILSVVNSFGKLRSSFHCSLSLVYGQLNSTEFLRLTPNKFKFYETIEKTKTKLLEKVIMKHDGEVGEFIVLNKTSIQSGTVSNLNTNWMECFSENNLVLSGTLSMGVVALPDSKASIRVVKDCLRLGIGKGISNIIASPSSLGNIPFLKDTGTDTINYLLTGWFNYSSSCHLDILKTMIKGKYTKEVCRKMLSIGFNKSTIIRIRERSNALSDFDDISQVEDEKKEFDVDYLINVLKTTMDDLEHVDDEDDGGQDQIDWFEDFMQESIQRSNLTFDSDPSQMINTSCEFLVNLYSEVLNNYLASNNQYIRSFLESAGIKPRKIIPIKLTSVMKRRVEFL